MMTPDETSVAVISALPFSNGQTEGISVFKLTFFNEILPYNKKKILCECLFDDSGFHTNVLGSA